MKKLLYSLVAAILTAACVHQGPPGPPTPSGRQLAFQVCTDASIELSGGWGAPFIAQTDSQGNLILTNWPSDRASLNLTITGAGLKPYAHVVETPIGKTIYHVGPCGVVGPLQPGEAQLPGLEKLWADTGERGRVRVEGERFVKDDGSTFAYRGFTAFRLYEQWLAQGPGIDPIVQDWLTCGGGCNARGPNVLRVLGMVDSFAHLWPTDHGDRYYTELAPFVDHLWNTFHVRVEFVVFADAQIIMPWKAEQDAHNERVLAAFSSATTPTIFWEAVNEPFKNIPDAETRAYELGRRIQHRTPAILVASGDYTDVARTQLDYVTVHTPRDDEWPRKVKDLQDIKDFLATVPVVGDEPMGFAEAERPGSRSTSTSDAAHFAATCQLFVAGCLYHSDAGIAFGLLGPNQRATATAFFTAMHWVPADAQFASYMRGGEGGGCGWVPDGDGPVEHLDALELRSFAKKIGSDAYVVQIRSTRATPAPCPGWRVVETPWQGLVKVSR